MPRSQRLRFTILAEGKRDYDFARAFLEYRYGRRRAQISRSQTVAAGTGSGEQAVREKLVHEVRQHRMKPQEHCYLVVVTDGDRLTAEQRRRQLHSAVEQNGLSPLTERDPVVIVMPCRNLETWFAWLDGHEVDETRDCKKDYPQNARGLKPSWYGMYMREQCYNMDRAQRPPSIADAIEQLRRLP